MPQLRCIIDHLPYGGVVFRKGDRFFASDEDARLLKGWGKASDLAVNDKALKSDGDLLGDGQGKGGRRGRYRRTDIRAED